MNKIKWIKIVRTQRLFFTSSKQSFNTSSSNENLRNLDFSTKFVVCLVLAMGTGLAMAQVELVLFISKDFLKLSSLF